MRVSLDECVPKRLRRAFGDSMSRRSRMKAGSDAATATSSSAMAAAGFTHFVTVDRNLMFQQNVGAAGVAHRRARADESLKP